MTVEELNLQNIEQASRIAALEQDVQILKEARKGYEKQTAELMRLVQRLSDAPNG